MTGVAPESSFAQTGFFESELQKGPRFSRKEIVRLTTKESSGNEDVELVANLNSLADAYYKLSVHFDFRIYYDYTDDNNRMKLRVYNEESFRFGLHGGLGLAFGLGAAISTGLVDPVVGKTAAATGGFAALGNLIVGFMQQGPKMDILRLNRMPIDTPNQISKKVKRAEEILASYARDNKAIRLTHAITSIVFSAASFAAIPFFQRAIQEQQPEDSSSAQEEILGLQVSAATFGLAFGYLAITAFREPHATERYWQDYLDKKHSRKKFSDSREPKEESEFFSTFSAGLIATEEQTGFVLQGSF